MEYIAHKNKNGEVQTIKEHCINVANICKNFSVDELKEINYCIGLLHDIGKYQKGFQKRIRGDKLKIEHSVCGALEFSKMTEKENVMSLLIELCIAGHHSGIPNCGNKGDTPDKTSLHGRLGRETEDYSAFSKDFKVNVPEYECFSKYLVRYCSNSEDVIEKYAFLVRYCYSCLVDADSLDTAEFMGNSCNRHMASDFNECLKKINDKLYSFENITELQKQRKVLQQQVFDKVTFDSDIYLMNMPTGSGKTLCSMKFALERVIRHNKKRIIYVIPYNSIIDQTCEVFETIFGDSAHILRHQSSYAYEDLENSKDESRQTAILACENWDADIIITTAVQFFASLYSNKRSCLRKMHNMSDSIILFDEAHLMPEKYFAACIHSVALLTQCTNSETVFLTATMPDFGRFFKEYNCNYVAVKELIKDKRGFDSFNKCTYKNYGAISKTELLIKARNEASCLIITNTKKAARELYNLSVGKKHHLSTWMTSVDRIKTISEIKEELKRIEEDYPNLHNVPKEKRILVVSTSLIEAGVDMDFGYVFREIAGLDNILQAGGRCNREGKRKNAEVGVFSFEENQNKKTTVKQAITNGIFTEYNCITSPEAIEAYYDRLFFMNKDDIIKSTISKCYPRPDLIGFAEYNDSIRLIDSQTESIVVETDEESHKLIEDLKNGVVNFRKLQKYSFSVARYEFEELLKSGVIDDYGSGVFCLKSNDYYDENTGVKLCPLACGKFLRVPLQVSVVLHYLFLT